LQNKILICTDLDRTLLPNGEQAESPQARQRFHALAQRDNVSIAYVTGRHQVLVQDAIEEFQLPTPNYVLGDVGSTIYEITADEWRIWPDWQEEIAPCWAGFRHDRLAALFDDINILRLQEAEKQNTFKLSYYAPEECNLDELLAEMHSRLKKFNIRASLIWSIDDLTHVGLLDVLPENATKLHAIEFLMRQKGYTHTSTLFAGDSGNDLPVLASSINSVLVANAREDVRQQAIELASENNNTSNLYIARGGFMGMNGNYSAGILEGLVHFIPASREWIA
jgi:HAD superfamily hydrolase (TIGR01484 family)